LCWDGNLLWMYCLDICVGKDVHVPTDHEFFRDEPSTLADVDVTMPTCY
jgi:hypothetical protein